MPELPDVEIFRQFAEKKAIGKNIKKIDIEEPKIAETNTKTINEKFQSKKLIKAERTGKFLFLPSSNKEVLVIHFGMTGFLEYGINKKPHHTRATITFSNGENLYFVNPRKLGRLYNTDDIKSFCKEKEIGIDALVIEEDKFLETIKRKKGMIKSALMDQSFIAGIGNIYSDEILFQSGIHPKTKITDLKSKDLVNLYNTMRNVLLRAIESGADPEKLPGNFIIPRRKEGEACPACGGEVKKGKVSGRGFYYCPDCQK